MRSDPLRAQQGSRVSSLLELRFVVAALGETNRWWRTSFLSATGLSFLQRIYPRTFLAAAIRSTCEAARLEHDARIGRGQVAHLFRLPSALERALDDALRGIDEASRAKHREILLAPDGPVAVLRTLAAGHSSKGGEGPVNCGAASHLQDRSVVSLLAAQYLSGFEAGRRLYPYLELGRSR